MIEALAIQGVRFGFQYPHSPSRRDAEARDALPVSDPAETARLIGSGRYAGLGGKPNSQQPELVKATIATLPEGSEIVAAFDADGAGRMLVEVVRPAVAAVAAEAGRADLIFTVHPPAQEGED